MRADDRDRERTTRHLGAAYATGALSTSTFEWRTAAALRARERWELRRLVDDVRRTWWTRRARAADMEGGQLEVRLPAAEGESLLLGRSRGCDVVVDDETVSRRHALVTARDGAWRLLDLSSTNGTFLGRAQIGSAVVVPGDVLALGEALVRLERPG